MGFATKTIAFLLLSTCVFVDGVIWNAREKYPDAYLETPGLIGRYGYQPEVHRVVTQDGYFITIHRICYDPDKSRASYKGVVILQHGILCSSAYWLLSGEKSPAFLLSDEGYDVWLPNFRGNYYSRDHVRLSKIDAKFWDFSYHQMGAYDLPAVIDHILHVTKEKQVYYIGHSMGCSAFYVLASLRPEYSDKIRLMISLAPVSAVPYIKAPELRLGLIVIAHIRGLVRHLQLHEWFPLELTRDLCTPDKITSIVCLYPQLVVSSHNMDNVNKSWLPVILSQNPSGISRDTFAHYGQSVLSGKFRQFDYGKLKNWKIYRTSEPPEYNLTKIKTPVAIYYGEKDTLAYSKDVKVLYEKLPNKAGLTEVKTYTHNDFSVAMNLYDHLFKPLMEFMQKY